jgi:dTDP-4-dehydrorhamnose 3,5-epimerase
MALPLRDRDPDDEGDRMRFTATDLPGVVAVEIEPLADERGIFARTFCAETFATNGLSGLVTQCSISWNERKGTMRGLHYQAAPAEEPKLVRCTRGRIFDVAVDLRPQSPAFRRWTATELSAERRNALYIPPGCAHGFLTLEADCEVYYQMGENYVASLARGVRWNDPSFGIDWPFTPTHMSERDATYPDFAL